MKFDVTLDLLEEMAECISSCNWTGQDEIYAYMKSCVTNSDDYDPEDWKNKTNSEVTVEQPEFYNLNP